MAHITSSWAATYCLEDPARTADPIFAADSSSADEARHILTSISGATLEADHPLNRARRTVAGAWSAEQPCAAATRLVAAHADTAHTCAAIADVAQRVVHVIAAAHSAARQAYADADAAILAHDLTHYRQELGTYPGWDLPTMVITAAERERVDSGRQAVIARLNVALFATYRDLDSGAADAGRSLASAPWESLPAAARPAVGHPADDQNQANLALLRRDLSDPAGPRYALALAVDQALRKAEAAGQTAQLLGYEPTDPPGQGSVAIAIGDVDAATSVSVVVPGIGNSPATIGESIPSAGLLNDEVIAQAGAAQGTSATVLWWGYDIPLSWPDDVAPAPEGSSRAHHLSDTAMATSAFGAVQAGKRLTAFTASLRRVMPSTSRLTLIGHSWGSLVVSQAALRTDRNVRVDDVVLAASPGVGFQLESADDYVAVDADHVYVVALPKDPVTMSLTDKMADAPFPLNGALRKKIFGVDPGPFGPDPADESFGANVIDVPSEQGSILPISLSVHALTNYLSGESLQAIAAVAAGNGPEIRLRQPN